MTAAVETLKLEASIRSALRSAIPITQKCGTIPMRDEKPSVHSSDSGYISTTSSPDTEKHGNVRTPEQRYEPTNAVNLAHESDVVSLRAGSRKLFSSKKKLKEFPEMQIPAEVWARFLDLQELFNKPLLDALSKDKKSSDPVSIKLKCFGEQESTAKPFIVVTCAESKAGRARQFFKQRWFKDQCKAPDGNGQDLHLILYDGKSRIQMLDGTDIPIYLNRDKENPLPDLNNNPHLIRITNNPLSHMATVGGTIEVNSAAGECMYGLTCGHILYSGESDADRGGALSESLSEIDEQTSYNSGSDDEFELDWGDSPNLQTDTEPRSAETLDIKDIDSSEKPDGKIIASSYDDSFEPNLDWALVEFQNRSAHQRNIGHFSIVRPGPNNSQQSVHLGLHRKPADLQRRVMVHAGVSGTQEGSIHLRSTFFLCPGSTKFIYVYTMRLDGLGPNFKRTLERGDSGAWVIDVETHQLHGHVIASDPCGDIYVVPMADIADAIQKHLKAHFVVVPTYGQVSEWIKQKEAARVEDTLPGASTSTEASMGTKSIISTLRTRLNDPGKSIKTKSQGSSSEIRAKIEPSSTNNEMAGTPQRYEYFSMSPSKTPSTSKLGANISAPNASSTSKQTPPKMHRRSRTGCFTCRLRRKKCDEGKPSCKACNHLGLKCEYKRPMWWSSNEIRRQQKESIKNAIKRTKFTEKAAHQQTASIGDAVPTPPSLCHSVPTSDNFSEGLVRTRGGSMDSQFSADFQQLPSQDSFTQGIAMPPQHGPPPGYPQFSPYEIDIKTERQMFVNDIPTRRHSTTSINRAPKVAEID